MAMIGIDKTKSLTRALMLAAWLSTTAYVAPALANPEGGVVVGGEASFVYDDKKLDIYQTSNRTVIDWRSFNIEIDEHTQFHQPSDNAIAFNRVNTADPSYILGQLSANGNIILSNPNGIFFGANSRVDVNGLIATTAGITTDSFMAGGNDFNLSGDPHAAIINEGLITAKEAGLIGLVAPNVANHGVIQAKFGRVQLASGDAVVADFYGDGLLKVKIVDEAITQQLVVNTGTLQAEGGTVAMTAEAARHSIDSLILTEGELLAPTVEKRAGKIVIAAAGSNGTDKAGDSAVIVQAHLDVSGQDAGEQGGSIEVLGDHIAILDGSLINASGYSAPVPASKPDGSTATMTADKDVRTEEEFLAHDNRAGGSIKIGGDYLGSGDTQRAKTLYVGDYAVTMNSAINSGDAGRTIFWSDDFTDFNGLVIAQGGENGGNGGFLKPLVKDSFRLWALPILKAARMGIIKALIC